MNYLNHLERNRARIRILNYFKGWRRHKSAYIEEAINHRGLEGVRTYIKDITVMLTYKDREKIFCIIPVNKWGEPLEQSYQEYIQKHVDELSGIDWVLNMMELPQDGLELIRSRSTFFEV